jgi:hypothetical protein
MSGTMRSRPLLLSLIALLLLQCACTNTAAIATFATQSEKALERGPAILIDINNSCLRRNVSDKPMTDYRTSPESNQTACAEFADTQKSLLATSLVLTDYFTAVSELASTGTTSVGKNVKDAAAIVASAGKFSAGVSGAVTDLASVLAQAAVDKYKSKHLLADLRKADPSITIIAGALAKIVKEDYIDHMLVVEQQSLTRRYETFLENVPASKDSTPVVQVLLQDRWTNDLRILAERRAAANSYITTLKTIATGHNTLTTQVSAK